MNECTVEESFMSTKSIDDEIKDLVNASGSVRMSKILCLVAQKLKQTDGFKVERDPENHKIITLSDVE